MSALQISIFEFDPARVIRQTPEKKEAKDENGNAITYYNTKILYRYTIKDDKGNPVDAVGDLYTEFPKITVKTGIITKKGKYEKHSVFVEFNLRDEKIRDLVKPAPRDANQNVCGRGGPIDDIYRSFLSLFFDNRATFGQGKLNNLGAAEGAVDYPIYWPTDKTTNQVIQGKNPSKFFQLFCWGVGPNVRRTPFIPAILKPDGKPSDPLDWDKLRNMEIDITPVIHWKQLYSAKSSSIQSEISSCIVSRIVPASAAIDQTATIKSMVSDETLTTALREQIEALERMSIAVKKESVDNLADSLQKISLNNKGASNNSGGTAPQLPIPSFNINGNNPPSSPPTSNGGQNSHVIEIQPQQQGYTLPQSQLPQQPPPQTPQPQQQYVQQGYSLQQPQTYNPQFAQQQQPQGYTLPQQYLTQNTSPQQPIVSNEPTLTSFLAQAPIQQQPTFQISSLPTL